MTETESLRAERIERETALAALDAVGGDWTRLTGDDLALVARVQWDAIPAGLEDARPSWTDAPLLVTCDAPRSLARRGWGRRITNGPAVLGMERTADGLSWRGHDYPDWSPAVGWLARQLDGLDLFLHDDGDSVLVHRDGQLFGRLRTHSGAVLTADSIEIALLAHAARHGVQDAAPRRAITRRRFAA